MQLDYGRQQDLELLYQDYQNMKSMHRRKQIEKLMSDIMSENNADRKLRDELIKATRANDRIHMTYCREELRRLQARKINNNYQL